MKKTIFSGVQPTGNLHLGNYLGAISQWVGMQDEYEPIFCVVDYHAITVPQEANGFKQRIIDVAKTYLAAGIDPAKATIFVQSDIKEHAELAWILNCAAARMSDLENMTQYKDKSAKVDNIGVGLFDYPVLMAADILLYNTDIVPVGHDQLQHIELARDLAKRFNHNYGATFKIPEALIRKEGARIMSLDEPTKKMSKSAESELSWIALSDSPEIAAKKIMRAATDSESEVRYDIENKPGISNLLTIYSLISNKTINEIEKEYAGKGYGDFKKGLAEIVSQFLTEFQARASKYSDAEVAAILDDGAKKVQPIATATINRVREKLGL